VVRREVVERGAVLPAEVEHVRVAVGPAERDPRAGALEQQVRDDRGAVHHARDVGGGRA
jgi:hypothetical protein